MTLDSTDPPHSPSFIVCPSTISICPLFGLFLLYLQLLSTLSFFIPLLPFCFPLSVLSVLSFLFFKPLSIYSSSGLISLSLATYLLSLLLISTFLSPPTHPSTFTCSHSDITKVLTYLAQASHDLVPPEVSCSRRYQFQHRFIACISLHCRTGLIA